MSSTQKSRSCLDLRSHGLKIPLFPGAGIAQLVERNLAKVEVASSSLVSRSIERIENFLGLMRP
jgi:hypothetical protein